MQTLISFDEQLSASFYQLIASSGIVAKLFVALGVGLVYLMPLILLFAWFAISRKASLRAAIVGIIAWQGLNKLIASLADRPRPSMSQIGVKELVFHRPDTSFPSDHSAFLMAVTATFYLSGQKALGHIALVITLLTGLARVGIGVHFFGDIVAGWLVGLFVALLFNAIRQPFDDYIVEPLIRLARRLHL